MQLFEYPDTVVATYLDRVARLPVADRELLDQVVREYGLFVPPHSLPFVWLHNLRVRINCFKFIRRSVMGCRDSVIRDHYSRFYQQLFTADWPSGAVGRVALGLFGVRMRTDDGARMYDLAVGHLLSRAAIGWRDQDTRPLDMLSMPNGRT
jgi:hypothetical protein